MKFKGYTLKSALGAFVIAAALLLGGSEMAYAQDHHHERREFREHQRFERSYPGIGSVMREQQRRERCEVERHQRFDRRFDGRYNRGYRR